MPLKFGLNEDNFVQGPLTLYLIELPFKTFTNRADPDQAALALVRAAQELPNQGLLFAYGKLIRYEPTLVDLPSNFFALCTNMKVNLYNYS